MNLILSRSPLFKTGLQVFLGMTVFRKGTGRTINDAARDQGKSS